MLGQYSMWYSRRHISIERSYYWLYAIYGSMLFAGTLLSKYLHGKMRSSDVVFVNCTLMLALFLCFPVIQHPWILDIVLAISGFVVGVLDAFINLSFLNAISSSDKSVLHMFHMSHSTGSFAACFLYVLKQSVTAQRMNSSDALACEGQHEDVHSKAVGSFVEPVLGVDATFVMIALAQIPVVYYCYWYSRQELTNLKDDNNSSQRRTRAEYQGIPIVITETVDNAKWRAYRVTALSTLMCFLVNGLQSVFPYYLTLICTVDHYDGLTLRRIFTGTLMVGRFFSLLMSSFVTPIVMIGVSVLGYGAACCCIIFDALHMFGMALAGFFLSSIYPNLTLYVHGFTGVGTNDRMYALISASALGTLLHPLMLWLLIDKFDARLFVALNFLAIILLVLLFVSVVNMQDQLEATEGKRNGFMWFVWHFLSGGGYGTRKTLRTRVQRLSQRITRLRPTSFNRASLYRFRPGSFNGASFYRIRQNRLKPLRINHPTPAPPFRTQCKVGFRQRPPSSQLPRQKVVVNTDENDSNRVDPGMSHTNNSSVNPTVHSCKQYSSSGETDMIAEESSQL